MTNNKKTALEQIKENYENNHTVSGIPFQILMQQAFAELAECVEALEAKVSLREEKLAAIAGMALSKHMGTPLSDLRERIEALEEYDLIGRIRCLEVAKLNEDRANEAATKALYGSNDARTKKESK